MSKADGTVTIENAKLIFRNFAGKESQFNREGDRNFSVILPEDIAQALKEDGWNVKYLKTREEISDETPYIPVSIGFDNYPARVTMITSRGRTSLGPDLIEILDWADIRTVDLIIRPYNYTVRGTSGIKAYLKNMYITIEEDELDMKYAEPLDLPSRSGKLQDD
jgi:hypothetical protein